MWHDDCNAAGMPCPVFNPMSEREDAMDATEKMAAAYWNAYREGYYAVGGKLDYPYWTSSRDPVRNETYRCMRWAAEALRDVWGKPFEEVFPDEAMTRIEAQEFVEAAHVPLIQAVHDAHKANLE